MKVVVKVALAVTAWLVLLVPLWYKTILVNRTHLDLDELQRYEQLSRSSVTASIPIAVFGKEHPDIAQASEYVLNKRMESLSSDRRFKVYPSCRPEVELCVNVKVGKADTLGLNSSSSNLEVELSQSSVINGMAPEVVAVLLFDHVYKDEIVRQPVSHEEITVGYSPRFHLAFSLLAEGGSPQEWRITEALQEKMSPLIDMINSTIARVTIDTQTGYYAELGCERKPIIEQNQLSTFVDFAEWSLASIVPYPTLNFVLYVPTSPLKIEKASAGSSTNAFIIPQWGGIYISNPFDEAHTFTEDDLDPVISKFSRQLLAILGMREPDMEMMASKASPQVRLAKLSRDFTIKGLKQAAGSLGSLRRLAESMPLIAIPEKVSQRANVAAAAIDKAVECLNRGDVEQAARFTSIAYDNAEKAFFDKHMVAQAFFPDEQKLAVYMPLIGPLCIVVFSCWFRFAKQKKEALSSATAATAEKEQVEKEETETNETVSE